MPGLSELSEFWEPPALEEAITGVREVALFVPCAWRNTWYEEDCYFSEATLRLPEAIRAGIWRVVKGERGLRRWIAALPALAFIGTTHALILAEEHKSPFLRLEFSATPLRVLRDVLRELPAGRSYKSPYHAFLIGGDRLPSEKPKYDDHDMTYFSAKRSTRKRESLSALLDTLQARINPV